MLFNSSTYLLLFLPLVTIVYWQLSTRPRMWLILAASLTFYGFWRIDFIPLVLFSALLDYWLALWIGRTQDAKARWRLLMVSVCANLAILGFFKYLIFATESAASIAGLLGYKLGFVELNIILPLGISFYIFQTMSYTIDVYRREIEPERDALKYMCFVTFFGQMVAGPILRAHTLLPQFENRPVFDSGFILEGLHRILAGLFLKVVLADSIAGFVDAGYARSPGDLGAIDAWTLAFLFGFQIYFDFAGYSHIAIGSAKLLGISLPENFNFPYMATSPRDFWMRWHISLSTWIRDYLYLPLVGTFRSSRESSWDTMHLVKTETSELRRGGALFGTWVVMGLWHGANWTFALWGLYHAVLVQGQRMLFSRATPRYAGLAAAAGFSLTFPLMMAGWVPFRCGSVADALTMWGAMVDVTSIRSQGLGLSPNSYLVAAMLTVAMILVWGWVTFVEPRIARLNILKQGFATAYYAATIAIVVVCLEVKSQFIYFQF